jgi:cytochrome d ubiquinol oxidase subunit II
VSSPAWRATWDWALTIGSLLLPLLLGIALGDLLHGLPLNQNGDFTGSFLDLLTPYGIWVGVTFLALTLAHGAMFLSLKTTGNVQHRAERIAGPLAGIALLAVAGFAIWTHSLSGRGVLPSPLQVAAFLLIVGAAWSIRDGHAAWGFAATTGAIAATVASLFVSLYPNVMVSSTNKTYNLTVAGTATGNYSLTVMTVVALVFTPVVIGYQAWSYHVFRARIKGPGPQVAPASATADRNPEGGPAKA